MSLLFTHGLRIGAQGRGEWDLLCLFVLSVHTVTSFFSFLIASSYRVFDSDKPFEWTQENRKQAVNDRSGPTDVILRLPPRRSASVLFLKRIHSVSHFQKF